jgi:hypothetical protein
MKGLEVLENVFLLLVGTSTSDCNSAATSFLDDLLGFALWADDLADVVGLGIVDGLLGQINFLELF